MNKPFEQLIVMLIFAAFIFIFWTLLEWLVRKRKNERWTSNSRSNTIRYNGNSNSRSNYVETGFRQTESSAYVYDTEGRGYDLSETCYGGDSGGGGGGSCDSGGGGGGSCDSGGGGCE